MKIIVAQNDQNEKQFSLSIKSFFTRFHIGSILREANAYKEKGISAVSVFLYLVSLVFTGRSMYMDYASGNSHPSFGRDVVYRFLNNPHINWMKFTTLLSSRVIRTAIDPLTSETRRNVLTIDDSMFSRGRSKKVELLAKVYDHAKKVYTYGFRMLTLGWNDGNTFLPVNGLLLSTENPKNRINESRETDRRRNSYKLRQLAQAKGTEAMLFLLELAKKADIPAGYVVFDSWFTSPKTVHDVKAIGYDVIGMLKKGRTLFVHNGKKKTISQIYRDGRKRRGRAKWKLSAEISVLKDGVTLPAKLVFVPNRSNSKEFLCLLSTDTTLSEEEIIQTYGKRWATEVFFKVCKSSLKLAKECNSLSYDAMTAHMAIVFTRYTLLFLESRESEDQRSLGELFMLFVDEMADITWIHAFNLLMDLFRETVSDFIEITEAELDKMMDQFMNSIPASLRQRLKCA